MPSAAVLRHAWRLPPAGLLETATCHALPPAVAWVGYETPSMFLCVLWWWWVSGAGGGGGAACPLLQARCPASNKGLGFVHATHHPALCCVHWGLRAECLMLRASANLGNQTLLVE